LKPTTFHTEFAFFIAGFSHRASNCAKLGLVPTKEPQNICGGMLFADLAPDTK